MSKIITDKCEITFAALKLVEQLYKDNEIPDYMFRNILRQYAGKEDNANGQYLRQSQWEDITVEVIF